MNKVCTDCKLSKDSSEFGVRKDENGIFKYFRSNCRPCESQRYRKWYQVNKEKSAAYSRKSGLMSRHGMTLEEYESINTSQKGICAICKNPPRGGYKHLVVDHCHETGNIRGLLCNTCNRAIGLFKDSPELLSNASEYLRNGFIRTSVSSQAESSSTASVDLDETS